MITGTITGFTSIIIAAAVLLMLAVLVATLLGAAHPIPKRKINNTRSDFVRIIGAKKHHLQVAEVGFLRGGLNVVTGMSGAGKSTLVHQIFFHEWERLNALATPVEGSTQGTKKFDIPSFCKKIIGLEGIQRVDMVSRKPLARTRTSMPATFLDIFTYLRQIFEKLPEAQIAGLKSRDFSLQVKGGRCEACSGQGEVVVSMKFLSDARVVCQTCEGQYYQPHVLSVRYQGHTIAQILKLTIQQAAALFKNHKKVMTKLQPALDMGLGYLRLGQSSLSLSGGEAQRLKLTRFLGANGCAKAQILILDEPTRGLHHEDTSRLLGGLKRFVNNGGTAIVVEHALDIIQAADWIIDLGPGSGALGGKVTFTGTFENLLKAPSSTTGKFFQANNKT